MKNQPNIQEWHVAKTGDHQGLICSSAGDNIAVSYRSEDAPLIAAAPDLLVALEEVLRDVATPTSDHPWAIKQRNAHRQARAAIAKAKGEL